MKANSTVISGNVTVIKNEVDKFTEQLSEWWDPSGPVRLLHKMNPLRKEHIITGFYDAGQISSKNGHLPLAGLKLADVGCGGGLLSEELAKLGADVTGIDANPEGINVAKEHAKTHLPTVVQNRLHYVYSSVEEYLQNNSPEQFDGVVLSEIVEHVQSPDLFLQLCAQLVKTNGSVFVTTQNRTWLSWIVAIIFAENILGFVPKGTHDWNMFVKPEETSAALFNGGCVTYSVNGMDFNPISQNWVWSGITQVSYALHAVKKASTTATANNWELYRCLYTAMGEVNKSSVLENEVDKFRKLSTTWWDPKGAMAALHRMNAIRIPYIRKGLVATGMLKDESDDVSTEVPFRDVKLLDIGCGGGFLSEELAKLGATVIGIDVNDEGIMIAKEHANANLDPDVQARLSYECISLQDFITANGEGVINKFDGVIMSELLEHVPNPDEMVRLSSKLLKTNGSMFVTTFNRTWSSWIAGIIFGEYILRLIPIGTHSWKMFLKPEEILQALQTVNCELRNVSGISYNIFTNSWIHVPFTSVNYALHAVKRS